MSRSPGSSATPGPIKNLTDSTRKIIYDQNQTNGDVSERSFKIGRDYSFSLGYQITF